MSPPHDAQLYAEVLAKTFEYLSLPAVVGHETPFLDHLARDYSWAGCKTERQGGMVAIDLGKPGPVFISHTDRHGAVIVDDGTVVYAAFANENTKYPSGLEHDTAFIEALNTHVSGEEVYAYNSQTGGRLAYGDVKGAHLDAQGRPVLNLAEPLDLKPGTPLAFSRTLDRTQSGYLAGQLDNAVCLAALRVAVRHGLGGRILLTSAELAGKSADAALSWMRTTGLAPTNDLIVCDTSAFEDGAAALAGAVILRRRDAYASFHTEQVARLEAAASQVGAPMIFKDSFIERENDTRTRRGLPKKSMGLTELGAITAASKGAYSGATLQLPIFNASGASECTTPRALTAFVKTVLAI